MADRAKAKSRAKAYTKSKKKGAMDGMTVKGGHKLSTEQGAGLTEKGRKSINRRTGSNLKPPAPNPKTKKTLPDVSRSVHVHVDGPVSAERLHVRGGTVNHVSSNTS